MRLLALVIVVLTSTVGPSQFLQTEPDAVQAVLDEFPPYEAPVRHAQLEGLKTKRAARALVAAFASERIVDATKLVGPHTPTTASPW